MLTRNKFSFHLDFFLNWKKKKMSRQWHQKHIFLFIQIVQEMSWNFRKCCSFFFIFICIKKLVVKIFVIFGWFLPTTNHYFNPCLQKLWKILFISSKNLFLFSRYSNFWISVLPFFSTCQQLLWRMIEDKSSSSWCHQSSK